MKRLQTFVGKKGVFEELSEFKHVLYCDRRPALQYVSL